MVSAHASVLMGAKQSLEESDDIASPRSPTSPRVLPVDGDEMPLPELLDKEASQADEALTPKSGGTVTLHNEDDDDAASPLDDEPGRAAYRICGPSWPRCATSCPRRSNNWRG